MSAQTYKQCATLVAKQDMRFRNPETGRNWTVRAGARFWVTSSQCLQRSEGCVRIDRAGQGSISNGLPFTPGMLADLFDTEENV